jgi:formylglycine-generating enzyme required for sulfatase activity
MGDVSQLAYPGDGEAPVHSVDIGPFAIDRYAVTNEAFAPFVTAKTVTTRLTAVAAARGTRAQLLKCDASLASAMTFGPFSVWETVLRPMVAPQAPRLLDQRDDVERRVPTSAQYRELPLTCTLRERASAR